MMEPELLNIVKTHKYMKKASIMFKNEGNKETLVSHKSILD